MIPDPTSFTWTRSALVAAAIVVSALIPVIAKDSPEPRKATPTPQARTELDRAAVLRAAGERSRGGRRACLAMLRVPASVLEQRWKAILMDGNGSGDTSVPMRGGSCWIKWSYGPNAPKRSGGYASKVRFYGD